MQDVTQLGGLPLHRAQWQYKYYMNFETDAEVREALESGIAGITLATEDDPDGEKLFGGGV